MREIKFRGKRVYNGEWVEGFVSVHTICGEKTYLATVINVKPQKIYDVESHEVDPATVGQYTGINDRNGVEIYEGDILRDNEGTYVVQWLEGDARFIAIVADAYVLGDRDEAGEAWELVWVDCAVIGNIHDNPELLEGVKADV